VAEDFAKGDRVARSTEEDVIFVLLHGDPGERRWREKERIMEVAVVSNCREAARRLVGTSI
jgi:hypothetical protein